MHTPDQDVRLTGHGILVKCMRLTILSANLKARRKLCTSKLDVSGIQHLYLCTDPELLIPTGSTPGSTCGQATNVGHSLTHLDVAFAAGEVER